MAPVAQGQKTLKGETAKVGVVEFYDGVGNQDSREVVGELSLQLMGHLVKAKIDVIRVDANHIQGALDQLGQSNSDFGDPNFRREIGKLVSADYMLYGTLSSFSIGHRTVSAGRTVFGKRVGASVVFTDTKASVLMQLVKVETNEVVAVADAYNEKSYKNVGIESEDIAMDQVLKNPDFQKFLDELLAGLTREVVAFVPVSVWERELALLSSGELYVKSGKKDGVTEDMIFQGTMFEEIIDANGEVVDRDEVDMGLFKVVKIRGGTTVVAPQNGETIDLDYGKCVLRQYKAGGSAKGGK
jgi:hypothetical protein